jgi:hypothetical protein
VSGGGVCGGVHPVRAWGVGWGWGSSSTYTMIPTYATNEILAQSNKALDASRLLSPSQSPSDLMNASPMAMQIQYFKEVTTQRQAGRAIKALPPGKGAAPGSLAHMLLPPHISRTCTRPIRSAVLTRTPHCTRSRAQTSLARRRHTAHPSSCPQSGPHDCV